MNNPQDYLTPSGKLKRFQRSNYQIEYDARFNIACNSETKTRFKACCSYLDMTEQDTLDLILKDYIQRVVEFAGENCNPELDLAFMDAGKMVQEPQQQPSPLS
ncbi:hypothetical protein [Methylomarinum vadi]|uniref:hypothetical protein n=1 Tax=Methylomarinum vadi TaxID=438855 RepID=UPI0004DFA267|nr:hypothetical protein [Methylomarinum vadi]